jgi:sugar lactone lactonase YvrE
MEESLWNPGLPGRNMRRCRLVMLTAGALLASGCASSATTPPSLGRCAGPTAEKSSSQSASPISKATIVTIARLPELAQPAGIAVDPAGNVYFAEAGDKYRVLKVTPAGVIVPVAGSGAEGDSGDGGPATLAQFRQPWGLALDGASNLFIADIRAHVIRKVTPAGTISTVAGIGEMGYSGDGGKATAASLNEPAGVAVDHAGNVYIADAGNHRIRKVALNGTISTVAGTGQPGYSGDGGRATSARLNFPGDVAVDDAGCLYIVDSGNHRIRVVIQNGTINTVVGNGQAGFSGDGGPATRAQLDTATGVAVDNRGTLYFTDYGMGGRIREVTPGGIISTVAGSDHEGYAGDGGQAIAAWLDQPLRVAVDSTGNLYVSDLNNDRIRKVSAG